MQVSTIPESLQYSSGVPQAFLLSHNPFSFPRFHSRYAPATLVAETDRIQLGLRYAGMAARSPPLLAVLIGFTLLLLAPLGLVERATSIRLIRPRPGEIWACFVAGCLTYILTL